MTQKYMPNDIQSKVSKAYPQYTEKQLHQFITIIAKCRNVCAHGERLFDISLRYLISNEEFKIFRRNLAFLIKEVFKKCPHLAEDQLLN